MVRTGATARAFGSGLPHFVSLPGELELADARAVFASMVATASAADPVASEKGTDGDERAIAVALTLALAAARRRRPGA